MSETPKGNASVGQFDLLKECIDTYQAAKRDADTDARIKALALIQKVHPATVPVKEDGAPTRNMSTVKDAQNKLRKA